MKYPFKLSRSNIIYVSIIAVLIIIFNMIIYGFSSFTIGYIFGSIAVIILIPTLFALLFWFILGRKEKGGTAVFNIVLTLVLFFGIIGRLGQIVIDKQKPIKDLKEAFSEYEKRNLENPDAIDSSRAALSADVKESMDELIKTSSGDERKVYLIIKSYFKKADSVNIEWNKSYNALMEPRILDFSQLNNAEEYKFQKKVVQDYVDESENYKAFIQNRVGDLTNKIKYLKQNNRFVKGFIKGFTEKDSIQKPIFIPYINAHIAYGKDLKRIIELLEKEDGRWEFEDETLIFQNSGIQATYEKLLNNAIRNEEVVNELLDQLVQIM